MTILLLAGFAIYMLGMSFSMTLHAGRDSIFFVIATAMVFVLGGIPGLIAYSLWKRDYASVVEITATLAGIIAFLLVMQIEGRLGIKAWLLSSPPMDAAAEIFRVGFLVLATVLPVYVGKFVYRGCCSLGFRWLSIPTSKWERRAA